MSRPPVPQRIPPLRWRGPAFVWTPLALAAGIGWPAAIFYNDAGLQKVILIVSAAAFAVALVTLGASWTLGRAPRTRRVVILHVLFAGLVASIAAPFVLTRVLATVSTGPAAHFPLSMSAAMAPLALMLGLPLALISGALFAWIALKRENPDELPDNIRSMDVNPFN